MPENYQPIDKCYALISCPRAKQPNICNVQGSILNSIAENSIVTINGDSTKKYILHTLNHKLWSNFDTIAWWQSTGHLLPDYRYKVTSFKLNGLEQLASPVEYLFSVTPVSGAICSGGTCASILITDPTTNNYSNIANLLNQAIAASSGATDCIVFETYGDQKLLVSYPKGTYFDITIYNNSSGTYTDFYKLAINSDNSCHAYNNSGEISLCQSISNNVCGTSDIKITSVIVLNSCEDNPPCGTCDIGYTLVPDSTQCQALVKTTATEGSNMFTVGAGSTNPSYGQYGAVIYDNITSRTTLTYDGSVFKDIANNPLYVAHVPIVSPVWTNKLNNIGVWSTVLVTSYNYLLSFNIPIYQTVAKEVCIGVSAKDEFGISIYQDDGSLYKKIASPVPSSNNYSFWHIFPITLKSGWNIISIAAMAISGDAIFGAEVYDCSASDLIALNTPGPIMPGQLDAIKLFRTSDNIGTYFDSEIYKGLPPSPGPVGYQCSLSTELPVHASGSERCVSILRTDFTPCCYILSACPPSDLNDIITNTNLQQYVNGVVIIDGYTNCWTVQSTGAACKINNPVTVLNSYDSCKSCGPTCYKLTDCSGIKDPIYTSTDLSSYLSKVIKLKYCNTCWEVSTSTTCNNLIDVILEYWYNQCSDCQTIIVTESINLKQRSVRPGYHLDYISSCLQEVNCTFANQVHNYMKQLRYGITSCCEDKLWEYSIKKELIDLKSIYDPDACTLIPVECHCPCNIQVSIIIPNEIVDQPGGDNFPR